MFVHDDFLDMYGRELGRGSLSKSSEELNERLTRMDERMKAQSQALLETHETFLVEFDEMATNRAATSGELNELVDNYVERRTSQRDDLLRLQDELHAALPPDAWADVRGVLNRRSEAIAAGTA